ncbi:hypothetical protein SK128_020282, partial [Halocaridina rubra]
MERGEVEGWGRGGYRGVVHGKGAGWGRDRGVKGLEMWRDWALGWRWVGHFMY